ncbi:uncharacterized protein LOC108866552 [Pyrus x bretschneideri]|uniref:uncharacterized protein LOC108866552 n=1 Tax=Pyrus x bretschneideri TaxID=225117 RepID=UPI00202ED439|nr:uncharacterized protein LOC108866552 [Pyrus x bretschneideri]
MMGVHLSLSTLSLKPLLSVGYPFANSTMFKLEHRSDTSLTIPFYQVIVHQDSFKNGQKMKDEYEKPCQKIEDAVQKLASLDFSSDSGFFSHRQQEPSHYNQGGSRAGGHGAH